MAIETVRGDSIPLKVEFTPPGDKSISHRAIIIGSLAKGTTNVTGFLNCDDTISTANAMRLLGAPIEINGNSVKIEGVGLHGLSEPDDVIDAGNSGTTARLLSGVLSGQKFFSVMTGDEYLRVRPMGRVVKPLSLMGGKIWGREGGNKLPLSFRGSTLSGISYELPVASAQVKSCILFAGLYANGETEVIEPEPTREHTERMLTYFGAGVERSAAKVRINRARELGARDVEIPGDISSASFFIVAALINSGSELLIKSVGLGSQRIGFLEILERMEARIEIADRREVSGEPVGDIFVRSSQLKSVEIGGDLVPRAIDEIPLAAVAASFAEGETVIRDAKELRVKETDRIRATVTELRKMGADIEELEDGMVVRGKEKLWAARCSSWGDHRIAMALSVAATRAEGVTEIDGAECVSVSFPGFFDELRKVRHL